jgi:pseudoazurin
MTAPIIAFLLTAAGAGHAAEHRIEMLGEGKDATMAFAPAFIHAAPGDSLRFLPVDPYHNAETIRGLFPDGAEAFKGALGEEFAVTLDREGVYLVMCRSHYAVGMVALVVVGAMPDRPTLEKAVAGPHPARAKAAFAAILDSLPGR